MGVLGIVINAAVMDALPEDGATANPLGGATGPFSMVFSGVLYLALTAGFVALAVFVGRGNNPARIVTWSVGGIVVLCCGCGLLGNIFGAAMLENLVAQSGDDTLAAVNDATPVALTIVNSVVSSLLVLGLVAVIIMLALPASNDFFRKEQEVWVPPTYPGDGSGGYPPVPPGPTPPLPPGPTPPSGGGV